MTIKYRLFLLLVLKQKVVKILLTKSDVLAQIGNSNLNYSLVRDSLISFKSGK